MDNAKEIKLVPAADKTLKIIEYMAQSENPTCGVTEIARNLGYNKGTVQPILRTLVQLQWAEKEPINGRYFLSNRLMLLTNSSQKNNLLITNFELVANDMERTCGELINLHFLYGMTSATVIAKVISTAHHLKVDFPIGAKIPILPSSAGKCLVCDYNDLILHRIYHNCYNRYTSSTIHSEEDFLNAVHRVHEQGYSTNMEEYEDNIFSVAAPVRNSRGTIIAAINIVIPQARFSQKRLLELIELVKNGANRLSQLQSDIIKPNECNRLINRI